MHCDIVTEKTIWQVVDSHWCNISRLTIRDHKENVEVPFTCHLCDYMYLLGIDYIPDSVTYFLATTAQYSIKYRVNGSQVEIYTHPV